MITSFYVGIFTLFFVFLSIEVIITRKKHGIAIGIGNNKKLELLTRAHGNFIEYTPIFLIMLFLLEGFVYLNPLYLHILAISFLLARISHMFSLAVVEKYEKELLKTHIKFRLIGMVTTFIVLIACASLLILNSYTALY